MRNTCLQVKDEEGDDDEDMDDDSNEDEEVVVPEGINVDPAVLSTLPPSMQVRPDVPDDPDKSTCPTLRSRNVNLASCDLWSLCMSRQSHQH